MVSKTPPVEMDEDNGKGIANYGTVSIEADEENLKLTTGKQEPSKETKPHKQHSLLGIFFIMLGSFSFSLMFLLVKLMAETNTFTLVLYRSLVQVAISLVTLLYHGENPLGPPGMTRLWLVMRGLFGSAAVCAWFFGIQILPLPDAVTLQFTTPAFAAVFAVCLVGERWKPLDQVGAVVCLTGVALIAHPTWLFPEQKQPQEQDAEDAGVLMKTVAVMVTEAGAAMAAIAYVTVRKIGHRASAVVMVLYYGVLSLPMCVLGSGWLAGTWDVWGTSTFTTADYFLVLLMGIAGYGGQWFTNLGLQKETAATATLATSTQIVWTYVFELAFLHEALNGWSLGGTGLILGYMIVVAAIKMFPELKKTEEEVEPLLTDTAAVLEAAEE